MEVPLVFHVLMWLVAGCLFVGLLWLIWMLIATIYEWL